jgi:2-phosphosulfolactate phosphatase
MHDLERTCAGYAQGFLTASSEPRRDVSGIGCQHEKSGLAAVSFGDGLTSGKGPVVPGLTQGPGASRPSLVPAWRAGQVTGAVVVVDVLRAFTTAAYAFAAGAQRIWLVGSVEEALAVKAARPGTLAMGSDWGRRVPGFDFSNSPVEVARADLTGCDIVQRTSAGTRGVVRATAATRRWCASLVCASATAAAVNASGLGEPSYVISGWFDKEHPGEDDVQTARLIERVRRSQPLAAERTVAAILGSSQAAVTSALGLGNADPRDVELATRIDAFDFAMEAEWSPAGLVLKIHC